MNDLSYIVNFSAEHINDSILEYNTSVHTSLNKQLDKLFLENNYKNLKKLQNINNLDPIDYNFKRKGNK